VGVAQIFWPLRGTNSQLTHYLLSHINFIFQLKSLDTLMGTAKAPAVDLLRLHTVKGAKTAIYI